MKTQLIRSATLKFYYDDLTILIDPYFAPKFSIESYAGISRNPLADLPIPPDEILKDVDAIIVSHMHSDHFDSVAKKAIDKQLLLYCQPEDEQSIILHGFCNVIPVHNREKLKGLTIDRFYGQHGYGNVLEEMGIVSGFIFSREGAPLVMWLGDTVLTDSILNLLINVNPEIIITHSCGAVWGDQQIKIVVDEEQTVRICRLFPKSRVIAVHMDSLDHGMVSRNTLREYARSAGISEDQLIIPGDGDYIEIL